MSNKLKLASALFAAIAAFPDLYFTKAESAGVPREDAEDFLRSFVVNLPTVAQGIGLAAGPQILSGPQISALSGVDVRDLVEPAGRATHGTMPTGSLRTVVILDCCGEVVELSDIIDVRPDVEDLGCLITTARGTVYLCTDTETDVRNAITAAKSADTGEPKPAHTLRINIDPSGMASAVVATPAAA